MLDTQETIDVVKDYMETYNFSVFEVLLGESKSCPFFSNQPCVNL